MSENMIEIPERLAQQLLDYVRFNSVPRVTFVEAETLQNALVAAARAADEKRQSQIRAVEDIAHV